MKITKKSRPVYKAIKDFSVGDEVVTPFNDNVKIISIQKSPKDTVYKINLSNGHFIKTGKDHYNTVCFRHENGKPIWDTVTTWYIFQHQKDFLFKFPTLPTFGTENLDYETALKIIPSHENDPTDDITPLLEKDENSVYVVSVEQSDDEESWCLTLNDPLGLYVLDHGSITHNSTFTQMALLYVAASFALMRDPWKFFNKSKTTIFAITLCAVTLTKAKEIYEEPVRQLIESADFWHYCRTHQEMLNEENHLLQSDEIEYIPWSSGSNVGVFKTGNNMTWKVISNANSLLGVNILMGAMTEITFFREAGKGWTDEKIFNFFSKLRERISNRFQNNYYARMILDSSPSTLEDPIQNWMTYDAPKDESCFVWRGARWDLYPEEFPEYEEVANPGTYDYKATNQKHTYDVAFQLYKGGNGKPPVACENELEASHYQPADLIWCPKKQVTLNGISNFLTKAKENPIEFMKDWAGLPAGTPDRLFYRNDWIENVFDNGLKNIYGSIIALADDEPEHLIWDKIWPMFFYKMMNKFYFYYEHDAPRVVSIDQSKSRDCTCIAMSHLELDPERIDEHTKRPLTVYITDFTIVLIPKGGHINLDAIKHFIYDLKVLGGLNIRHVSFDGWQSEPARQALKRSGINVDYVSVDSDNEPYYMFYDAVTHGRYFAGKNIFMKNNMKSLHEVRRKRTGSVKIDHFEGDLNYEWENGTWESCTAGINAKDCLDAVAANLHLFSMYPEEFIATKKFYKEDKLERDYDTIKDKNTSFLESGKINGMKFKI